MKPLLRTHFGLQQIILTWVSIATAAWTPHTLALDEAELCALLEDARGEMDMPGLRAAVRFADGRVVQAAVGLADVEASVPLDSRVGMPGGSTGKTFVAALTMLLVEDGTLSLDDSVSKWLQGRSWFNRLPNHKEIRVRHLLTHTAGIRDYPDATSYQLKSFWRAVRHGSIRFDRDELIGFVLDKKPLFAVGEGYGYTDAGYLVLGEMIEAASGRDYYELLTERILQPHKLSDVRPADRSILSNITPGYNRGARNLKEDGRMKFDPSSEWTGGGLTTNPTMLVEFFAALAHCRIVTQDSFVTMLESGWRDSESPTSHYGLGVYVYDSGDSFGNAGMWPGYRTQVLHNLRTGITVAVQTNRDGRLDMAGLVDRIVALGSRG